MDLEGGRKLEPRASGMLEKAYNTWSEEQGSVQGSLLSDIPIFVFSVEFYCVDITFPFNYASMMPLDSQVD